MRVFGTCFLARYPDTCRTTALITLASTSTSATQTLVRAHASDPNIYTYVMLKCSALIGAHINTTVSKETVTPFVTLRESCLLVRWCSLLQMRLTCTPSASAVQMRLEVGKAVPRVLDMDVEGFAQLLSIGLSNAVKVRVVGPANVKARGCCRASS